MPAVRWHTTMSLDGFIAGPDDDMSWIVVDPRSRSMVEDVMTSTGAILAGRRWYDVATARLGGRGGIYGGAWSGPVLVLTHRPDPPPEDPGVTFVSGSIEDAVAATRAAAGGKAIELFGATTAQQALRAGLVDEIVVHVAPVLLGDGVPFHGGLGPARIALERTAAEATGPVTDLRFRVRS